MDIREVVKRIGRCMELEDRKDVEFRALIALTELGDIVKYITHDPELNPRARPHGTKNDEALAYGQALVQTIATMLLRGIDVQDALELGIGNWEDVDWRKRSQLCPQLKQKITGKTACKGKVRGMAYIVSDAHLLSEVPEGHILVVPFVGPNIVEVAKKVSAIVSDHGGLTCHAAIVARELNIPCIVGAGEATRRIAHGDEILVNAEEKEGVVEIIQKGA